MADAQVALELAEQIKRRVKRPWRIMEVCGGQTHAILKHGLDQVLPQQIEFLHGPGCPVCVTPTSKIDQAIALARQPGVILCTLGDMLRVPGSDSELLAAKADGAEVQVVYSPLDAVNLAAETPNGEIVLFAIGFETTAPLNALAISQANEQKLTNFSILSTQVLVPPAVEAIMTDPEGQIDALLAAGHVCTVMGYRQYEPLAERFSLPIVVTGFSAVELLRGTLAAIEQLESGRHEVENRYAKAVNRDGNPAAQEMISQAFQVCDTEWRGLGVIPRSGLALRQEHAQYDAVRKFSIDLGQPITTTDCRAGAVLQGKLKPDQCPLFGLRCTPESPVGAPMVSAEGACAAYYHAGRRQSLARHK